MKVLVVSSLFAVLSAASAGSAVAWPGARVVIAQPTVLATHATALKTVVPPQTKVFGFSTTQYINSVPSAIALQPPVHYQVPELSHFAPVQHTSFYPIAGGSYFPSNVFYPPFAITPGAPGYPAAIAPAPVQPAYDTPSFPQGTPGFPSQDVPSFPPQGTPGLPSQDTSNFPSQTAGDADTAVVDSADFPQQQTQDQPQEQPQEQSPSTEAPQQDQPSAPQFPPAGNFPFPSLPQAPQGQAPSFPSFPQFPQGSIPQFPQGETPAFPSFPQFPQGDGQPSFPSFPQFPQGSLPQFPQLPQFPSNPNIPQSPIPTPPSSFPGDAGGDKGLNDEDTISVESA